MQFRQPFEGQSSFEIATLGGDTIFWSQQLDQVRSPNPRIITHQR